MRKKIMTAVSQHCEGQFASPKNIVAAKNRNRRAV